MWGVCDNVSRHHDAMLFSALFVSPRCDTRDRSLICKKVFVNNEAVRAVVARCMLWYHVDCPNPSSLAAPSSTATHDMVCMYASHMTTAHHPQCVPSTDRTQLRVTWCPSQHWKTHNKKSTAFCMLYIFKILAQRYAYYTHNNTPPPVQHTANATTRLPTNPSGTIKHQPCLPRSPAAATPCVEHSSAQKSRHTRKGARLLLA